MFALAHAPNTLIIGSGYMACPQATLSWFKALSVENVNIKVIATSEIKISVLIDRKYMELAVQALHDAFELQKA
jgi:aspartate kinase